MSSEDEAVVAGSQYEFAPDPAGLLPQSQDSQAYHNHYQQHHPKQQQQAEDAGSKRRHSGRRRRHSSVSDDDGDDQDDGHNRMNGVNGDIDGDDEYGAEDAAADHMEDEPIVDDAEARGGPRRKKAKASSASSSASSRKQAKPAKASKSASRRRVDVDDDDQDSEDEDGDEALGDTDVSAEGYALSGILTFVQLEYFRSHKNFRLDFGPNLNVIKGQNGSGKSSILMGIQFALGARGNNFSSVQGLQDLIYSNSEWCRVTVGIKNQGASAYRPEVFGPEIRVERRFNRASKTSQYRLMGQRNTVST